MRKKDKICVCSKRHSLLTLYSNGCWWSTLAASNTAELPDALSSAPVERRFKKQERVNNETNSPE